MEQLKQANLIVDRESMYKLAIIATKGDLKGSRDNYEFLKSITSLSIHPISIKDENSIEKLKEYLFNSLEVIRIYTKPPRDKPDYEHPFICPIGTTVSELTEKIHKDFLTLFRYARVWGSSVDFQRKRVGLEHELFDSDTVEITLFRT